MNEEAKTRLGTQVVNNLPDSKVWQYPPLDLLNEYSSLREILISKEMQENKSILSAAIGLDSSKKPVILDLSTFGHLLITGTTGTGKSATISSLISTYLFRTTPNEIKLILVDPNIVELSGFNNIPNLITPVITDARVALSALNWSGTEMERRYHLFASTETRNIAQYNEQAGFQALPYIVVVIDELAEIATFAPQEVLGSLMRLTTKGRAAGIHLIASTSQPSIITPQIREGFATRASFRLVNFKDSEKILGSRGAEKITGQGNLLYIDPGIGKPVLLKGILVSDGNVEKLVKFLRSQALPQTES